MELGHIVEKKHVVGDSVPAILDEVLKGNRTLIVIQTFPQHGNPIGAIAESPACLSSIPVSIVK
jgi:hypothetical protein